MYDYDWFKDIKEVNFAPGFNRKTYMSLHDLALVELKRPFEPRYVKPACFAYKKKAYNHTGDKFWVSLYVN